MSGGPPDNRGPVLFLVFLVMAALIAVAWGLGRDPPPRDSVPLRPGGGRTAVAGSPGATPRASAPPAVPNRLPGGRRTVFGGNHFLVAYYGTAGTGALGVLGETPPRQMQRRVRRAAVPFRAAGRPVQIVYELIVTIADRSPGPDGDYSHDIARRQVQRYLDLAHRHGALLLLDLQPGRSDFAAVARRWAWALADPWVGLALDPEWRMPPHGVPARTVGHVGAGEVNRTSAWLAALTHRDGLPQKLFVVHQFRTAMVRNIDRVRARRGLATVQHVDGFGTRRQKLATYHAVARPDRFWMGLKIFYDEDVHRVGARFVDALRPPVRFVSYQ